MSGSKALDLVLHRAQHLQNHRRGSLRNRAPQDGAFPGAQGTQQPQGIQRGLQPCAWTWQRGAGQHRGTRWSWGFFPTLSHDSMRAGVPRGPYLEQGLDTGLEDHVGVEQEGAEQRLGVAGQLGHQPRQQEVDIERVVGHVLQLPKQHRHEGAWGHGGGSGRALQGAGTLPVPSCPPVKGWLGGGPTARGGLATTCARGSGGRGGARPVPPSPSGSAVKLAKASSSSWDRGGSGGSVGVAGAPPVPPFCISASISRSSSVKV